MNASALQVKMFGTFSIKYMDQEITTSNSRSRKIWLLLAYLIYYRKRRISRDELMDLLWPRGSADQERIDPSGALKTTFYRARTLLNKLDPSLGHTLISLKDGNYILNRDIQFSFDIDAFESLVRTGETSDNDDISLEAYLKAASVYQGDFLPVFSTESWVIPISTYYHNVYVHTILNALSLLEKKQRLLEAVDLCRSALKIAPDQEGLYHHLMQDLLNLGDSKAVISVYNDMRKLFLGSFGIIPSEDLRSLYHDALYTLNHQTLNIQQVMTQLKEPSTAKGALFCDYDFFKTLYHTEIRAADRTKDIVYICLLTMTEKSRNELSKRSLDRCMEHLHDLLFNNLRKSDVVSRCSASQYILLLPNTNYQNCHLVCERLQQAFHRQFPHSPCELTFVIAHQEPTSKK